MNSLIFLFVRFIQLYELLVFIRIVISWIQVNPYNPIIQMIARLTDPLLDAVRRAFPFLVAGGLDLSPILVFILLEATQRMILRMVFILP